MAFVSVSPFPIPRPFQTSGTTTFLIDAAGEKLAYIIRCPEDGTLETAGFAIGTTTQVPANGLKISFQGVSAVDGFPDGVVGQFRVIPSGSITANSWCQAGIISSDGTDSGTKRTVSQGELIAVVVEYSSFSAGDSVNLLGFTNGTAEVSAAYCALFTASWAKNNSTSPSVALKYTDGYKYMGYTCIPSAAGASGVQNQAPSSSTTPDEIALKFRLKVPMKINGFWFLFRPLADCDFVLYDTDGATPLRTVSIDKDQSSGLGTIGGARFAELTLSPNVYYYLAYKPTTTTAITAYRFVVNDAAILDQLDCGQDFHYASRTDAGAWTADTTKRAMLGLLVSALDDGGSGGIVAPLIGRIR